MRVLLVRVVRQRSRRNVLLNVYLCYDKKSQYPDTAHFVATYDAMSVRAVCGCGHMIATAVRHSSAVPLCHGTVLGWR